MLSMQGMMKKSPGPCEPPRFTRPSRKMTARWYSCAHSFGQCWGSVTFWCGSRSGSRDPYLWLVDPDPAPTPDPDPTPDPFFHIFFLITCPHAHHLQSKKLNFLLKFVLKFNFAGLFQFAQHIYEKREGSGSGSAPLTNGSGSGRPKSMRLLRIRIPNNGFGQGQIDPAWKPHTVKARLKPRGILIYLSGQSKRFRSGSNISGLETTHGWSMLETTRYLDILVW